MEAAAPGMIIGGRLVDSIGRRKVLLVSQVAGALAVLACGFVQPSMRMVSMLMLSSVLYSAGQPAFDALIADITVPANRKASYSLTYMGWNLGFAIGPIIGGFFFKYDLPLVFIGDALTTLVSALLIFLFVGESKGRADALKQSDDRPLEQHVSGSVFSLLLKRRILLYFALVLFCYQFVYSQWDFTLPLQMNQLFQSNGALFYGLLASANGLVVIVLTPLLVRLTRRRQALTIMAVGGFCYALSFGLFGFVRALPLFYLGVIVMTIGEILISVNSSAFIADYTPASHRGRVSSILPMITGAGYTLGPILIGHVIAAVSIRVTWLFIALIALCAASGMTALKQMAHLPKQ
ncbi:MAG: MFS transporter [Sporolactobacillus sp.]